jgi:hypothetical protein
MYWTCNCGRINQIGRAHDLVTCAKCRVTQLAYTVQFRQTEVDQEVAETELAA